MKTVLFGVGNIQRRLLGLAVACSLAVVVAAGNGCSVYMAASQPGQKNLDVFSVGTPRSLVLAEVGQPQASEMKDGKRVDVFSFVQGYSKGAKAGRAFFHAAADFFTLGLWEAVGTPTEAVFSGDKVAYEVTYDSSDKVEKVVSLIREKDETAAKPSQEVPGEPTKATNVAPKTEPSTEETSKNIEPKTEPSTEETPKSADKNE
jgi:hypothetical protein